MPTHIDAYPHNCPACIASSVTPADALDEHAQAVLKLRAEAKATPMRSGPRNASPTAGARHRGAKR